MTGSSLRSIPKNIRVLVCAIALLLLAGTIYAQSTTGTILGTITDASGGVLPGASVTVTNTETGIARTTNSESNGSYQVPALPPGPYRIEVTLDGFKSLRQEGLRLEVAQNRRVDARLELGTLNELITVTADALTVDTHSSAVGMVIDSDRLDKLPMVGRGTLNLALLAPGVGASNIPDAVINQRNGPTISAGGSRNNQNNVMLDGATLRTAGFNTAQPLPSPDSLQEFQVLTSTYTAEYGDASGATLMAITKSGTNNLTGSAWEYLRNDALTAKNYFAPSKPFLRQNQFGGTLGGPIIKGKTFFFANYEGIRVRTQQINRFFTPTAAQRTGDFSALSTPIRDPLTGLPFAGNIIPRNRLDPMVQNIINMYLPLPNFNTAEVNNLVSRPIDGNQVTAKVDQKVTSQDTVNVRFYRNKIGGPTLAAAGGNIDELADRQANTVQGTTASGTQVFRSNLVGEGRFSYTTITTIGNTSPNNRSPEQLGALWVRNGTAPLVPQVTVSGSGFAMSTNQQDWYEQGREIQMHYKLSWTSRIQSVMTGVSGDYQMDRLIVPFQTSGVFTFTGTATGNSMADFLVGQAATFSQYSQFDSRQTQGLWGAFFQDDLRLAPRFTANLGLRYEFGQTWVERGDHSSEFRLGQQSTRFPNAPLGLVAPGDAGIPRTIFPRDKNNFAPRLGGAWDVRGDGRTAVRGAWGIFYAPVPATVLEQQNENPPFTQNYTTTPTPQQQMYNVYNGVVEPFPFRFNEKDPVQRFATPMQLFTFSPDFKTGYLHQFNVNLQQQLLRDIIVQIGYYGSRGRKLLSQREINAAVFGPGATSTNAQQRRPINPAVYASIAEDFSDARSEYNSMQLTATKKYSDGYTVQLTYALSRSKDNRSGNGTNAGAWQDPSNGAPEWALSDLNQTHILRVNGLWEIPWGREKPGLVGHVLGGWRVAGVVSKLTGQPLNVVSGQDVALVGTSRALGAQRPDLVAGADPNLPANRSQADKIAKWFNTATFVRPATGSFGNSPRNPITGPGSFSVNASLAKRVDFGPANSKQNMEIRIEAFNLLNTVNLGNPVLTLTASNFGQIITAGDPRIVQIGLRFGF
jgi:hypothetical protein